MRNNSGRNLKEKVRYAQIISVLVFALILSFYGAGTAQEKKILAVDEKFEKTYSKGADYLVSRQNADGSWTALDQKPDTAMTGLVLSALADAPPQIRAKYEDNINKGVKFLLTRVQKDGRIIDPEKFPTMTNYKTSIALMAFAATDKEKYKEIIEKAKDYLVSTQWSEKRGVNEKDWNYGGWDYDEKSQKPGSDLSNVGMTLDALESAGLDKNSDTYKRVVVFLNRCQNNQETNDIITEVEDGNYVPTNDGGFIYAPNESKAGEVDMPDGKKGLRSYGSMTYIGLKSMIYASLKKDDPRVKSAYNWIQEHYTLDENPELGRLGWYYYFQVFAKAMDSYGEAVIIDSQGRQHNWAVELLDKLSSLQQRDGSWKNEETRWWEDYPLLVTSYCLLSLNSAYKWTKN